MGHGTFSDKIREILHIPGQINQPNWAKVYMLEEQWRMQ